MVSIIKQAVRVLGSALFIFLYLMFLIVCLPLRLLNPVWRLVGFKHNKLPTDYLQQSLAKGFVSMLGIKVDIEGAENVPLDQPVVLMYNHVSSLDPFTVMGWSPVAAKFIFKKELVYLIPPLGGTAYFYGHVPINRKNHSSALKSLDKAAKKMKKYNRSVAIAPEGTRSHSGELQPFKKGGFHLACQAEAYVIPTLLLNNFELWPHGSMFPRPGRTVIKFLTPIKAKKGEVEELIQEVRKAIEDGLAEAKKNPRNSKLPGLNQDPCGLALGFLALISAVVYSLFLR
eukprot:TRINITY_DN321_c1_g2_i1.p1 TRINITY_DN321_c1_g2~~TRINITY_DN321_c1_g2_i1.p1  ORF type:complete len:286 (+),score=70.35 TRINITY_DN321_c1_g2_i1:329-1186(+)